MLFSCGLGKMAYGSLSSCCPASAPPEAADVAAVDDTLSPALPAESTVEEADVSDGAGGSCRQSRDDTRYGL